MTNKLSLYIHIPFCVKKCDYCAFYSIPNADDALKESYFKALLSQIGFFRTDRIIGSVYFGGGTPPMLGIDRLCKLISFVGSRFTLADDCEITVEVNPNTVDYDSLLRLRLSGANRLSVGIQAADDKILASIGRIHSFAQAERCINNARLAGFNNVSADIIFALPYQSCECFVSGVKKIMSTNPDHISAYSLQLEEGTPLFERRQELVFPDEEAEEAQYESLCALLTENGYTHYEISSFCKAGFESRHNLNYWARGEYVGFGAAAHSFFGGKRFSAPADVSLYINEAEMSLFAPTDYVSAPFISDEEAEEERILLGLRTSFGALLPKSAHRKAERIASLGYGSFKDGRLALNSRGFRVSNGIIAEILSD